METVEEFGPLKPVRVIDQGTKDEKERKYVKTRL